MSIFNELLLAMAPVPLPGILAGDWLSLLCDNRFRIQCRGGMRVGTISACSIVNSLLARYEEWRYGDAIRRMEFKPPVFILGHWRSGTTLLHNLLALDSRFATPSLFDVLFPHTCLTSERFSRRPLSIFLPPTRFTDNVRFGLGVPYEDELALCTMSLRSPHLSVVFPERSDHYERFLTLRGLPDADVAKWRTALIHFLRKLTLKYQRPVVLKSPPHTARIRVIVDMFPKAKFVHIHRNPYEVFQSTLKLALDSSRRQCLQEIQQDVIIERVLRWYHLMYEAFFDERHLIPEGSFHELSFTDLEADMVGTVRRAYEALDLPRYGDSEPEVRRFAESQKTYRKTGHDPINHSLRLRIAEQWGRCFDEWRYPM